MAAAAAPAAAADMQAPDGVRVFKRNNCKTYSVPANRPAGLLRHALTLEFQSDFPQNSDQLLYVLLAVDGEQEFLQDHHPLPPPSKQVRAWELLKYSDKALYRRAKPSQLPPDSFQSGMLFALDDEDVTVDDQHHQLNPLIKLVGGESRLCGSSLDSWHPSKMLDSATSPMSDRERNAYASQPTAPDTWSQLNAPVPDRADPLFLTNNTKPQPRAPKGTKPSYRSVFICYEWPAGQPVPDGFALVHDGVGTATHHLLVPVAGLPMPGATVRIDQKEYHSWPMPMHPAGFVMHCINMKANAEPAPLPPNADDGARGLFAVACVLADESDALEFHQLRVLDTILSGLAAAEYNVKRCSVALLRTLANLLEDAGPVLSFDAQLSLGKASRVIYQHIPAAPAGPFVSLVAYAPAPQAQMPKSKKGVRKQNFCSPLCSLEARFPHDRAPAFLDYASLSGALLAGTTGSVLAKLMNVPQADVASIRKELDSETGRKLLGEIVHIALPSYQGNIEWFTTAEVDELNRPVVDVHRCRAPELQDTTFFKFFFSSLTDIARGRGTAESTAMYLINMCRQAWGNESKLYFLHVDRDSGLDLSRLLDDDFWKIAVCNDLNTHDCLMVEKEEFMVFPNQSRCAFVLVAWNAQQFVQCARAAEDVLKFSQIDITHSCDFLIPSQYTK